MTILTTEPRTITVPPEAAGQRLDIYLVSEHPDLSRAQVQRLIEDGHVHVERKAAKSNLALRPGDTITVDIPPPQPARNAP